MSRYYDPDDGMSPEEEREEDERMRHDEATEKINNLLDTRLKGEELNALAILLVTETAAATQRVVNEHIDRLYKHIDTIDIAIRCVRAFDYLKQHHPGALRGNNWAPEVHDMLAKAEKAIIEARVIDDRVPF